LEAFEKRVLRRHTRTDRKQEKYRIMRNFTEYDRILGHGTV
jgi:hypothetical protein